MENLIYEMMNQIQAAMILYEIRWNETSKLNTEEKRIAERKKLLRIQSRLLRILNDICKQINQDDMVEQCDASQGEKQINRSGD